MDGAASGGTTTTRAPRFADRLGAHGDAVALLTADDRLTYAELDARVEAMADRLGDARRLVLVTAANRVEPLVAYLAALRGGHPVLLVPDDAVRTMVAAYDPDVVVAAADGWGVEERRRGSAHDLHPDLALLVSTSGSTGSPKLVRLSGRNLEANAAAIADYLAIEADDRAITSLPMQYCYGLSVVNSHLLRGAGLVLTELSVVDRCFWDLFGAAGATSLAGVPHTFDLLDRVGFESMSLPTLRCVTQAGGKLDAERVRRYAALGERRGWRFFVMYGQTEATARMAYLPPELATSHPTAIGVPIPGGSFSLEGVDDEGVGELVYRGPNVMLGYAEEPADLALGATVDALRTGDLARVNAAGLYEVVGRRSRFVKLYGLRIDLDRVERLLAEQSVSALCAGDDTRMAVAAEGDVDSAAVAALVVRLLGLPRSAVHVTAVERLPRLATGKPDYVAVVRSAGGGGGAAVAPTVAPTVEPSATAEARVGAAAVPQAGDDVRAVYADILGVDPADDDTFVSLGGDSLSYVEASVRLERVLGCLPADWHVRPVRELVRAPAASRRRRLRATETSVVLRAVGILLVVGSHTELWDVPGGAHALLAVAGFNFARFQLGAANLWRSIARVAVPSALWIGAAAAVTHDYRWPHALLVRGLFGEGGDRWSYWYVEALVHLLAVTAVVLAVPAVRRLERRAPFAFAMGIVALALLVRFDVLGLPTLGFRVFRPHEVLWLFALGWAAARAAGAPQRLLVSAVALAALPGFFDEAGRAAVVGAGMLLLVWVPAVRVPALCNRFLGVVASASLYVYLTHWQVYPDIHDAWGPAAAAVASVVVGVAVSRAAAPVMAAVERLASRARRGFAVPAPPLAPPVRSA